MLLAQIVPGEPVPVQWAAAIPNDAPWTILAGAILAGSALFTFGIHSTLARWAAKGWITGRTPLYGEIAGYALGPILGGYAGWLVWHWGLGALCGFTGSWASPWVMGWLGIGMTRVVEQTKSLTLLKKPGAPVPPAKIPPPPTKKP